jgi:hypothetical protein
MQDKRINIGFDFGTSTTKICYYDFSSETHLFYPFYKNLNNIERYCKPSVIRFHEDKIYFNDLPYGKKIKLFKMGIHEKNYPADNPYWQNDFKAYQLVALYCAHLLQDVKPYLNNRYRNPTITINFGIPVDHLSNQEEPDKSKEKFFKLAFGIACLIAENDIDLEGSCSGDLIKLLKEKEEELSHIPNPDDLFKISPETIAGVGALLLDYTLSREYRYSIIDIGAGTTDVSFFHMGDVVVPEGKIYVYNSKTVDIGNDYNINNYDQAINNLQQSYRIGFGNSYFRCPAHWKTDFSLLFLGGGSRGSLKHFMDNLDLTIPGMAFHQTLINPVQIKFPIPEDTVDAENEKLETWKDNFDILAVSYGLSYPFEYLPIIDPQVPPPIRPPVVPGFDESLTPDVG